MTLYRNEAVRAGLSLVKKVINANLTPAGLTTTEIYKLVRNEPVSPDFQPPERDYSKTGSQPPHPEHPVRSIRYLKKTLLPMLQGNGLIKMSPVTRTEPVVVQDKKAGKFGAPSSTGQRKVWAWRPLDPNERPKPKIPSPPKRVFGEEVGVGEDWSHLNSRRRRAREGKVAKDAWGLKKELKQ
ncbi:hypothetical protein AMATHDRAFT_69584 [Amanita thiersii Skay4041]|uniref:Uncharacterized protein n=1 Tax=Amanita thiersii Skay4041 TaxID=703135 RepID=A0A2A9NFR7_9AGAR|nr:hypothetical protein AMATHDRAFT_69584 [Amanita thiersii Skay4041]